MRKPQRRPRHYYGHVLLWRAHRREHTIANAHVRAWHRYYRTQCPAGHPYSPENTVWRERYNVKGGKRFGPYHLRECHACKVTREITRYYYAGNPKRVAALARNPWKRERTPRPGDIRKMVERSMGL